MRIRFVECPAGCGTVSVLDYFGGPMPCTACRLKEAIARAEEAEADRDHWRDAEIAVSAELARVTAERDALMAPGIIEGMRRACLLSRDTTPEGVLRHLREVATSYEAVMRDQDELRARAKKAEARLAEARRLAKAIRYEPAPPTPGPTQSKAYRDGKREAAKRFLAALDGEGE